MGAVLLSIACLNLDHHLNLKGAENVDWLWKGGTDGARSILSTIAGSMITVAGVVFSITIVALTLASSQFGPRLLRNFVRDTVNQVVLGTFVATYLYCLLVLREVRDINETSFVPYLSVTMAVALTTASLGMLIFFIHHVALSIQAENMVASVAAELRESIATLFPEKAGTGKPPSPDALELEKRFDQEKPARVLADKGGYVQAIELEAVMQCAKENDLILRLLKRPGEFICAGGTLAEILPAARGSKDLTSRVAEAHIIEARRTPRQDAEYCVNQLVEIAVRALSPGINDPFTAIACIHWLGDGMSQAVEHEMPARHRFDDEGALRVVAKVATFEGLADAAFNAIRQYGAASPSVAICLLETFAEIVPHTVRGEDLEALALHAEKTARDALGHSPDPRDAADIEERIVRVRSLKRAAGFSYGLDAIGSMALAICEHWSILSCCWVAVRNDLSLSA